MTSELSRRMVAASQMSDIKVALDRRDGVFGLVLLFLAGQPVKTLDVDTLKAVFDDVEIAQTTGGLELIETFKSLPVPKFEPAQEFIDEERQLVQPLSSEELYRRLEERTKELQESRDKLEQSAQLIQTAKMGVLGIMAAGIAHELLNPMMGIMNYAQFCRKRTAEDDPRYKVLQDIERETKRCTDIVKNVVTFSRMGQEGEEEYQKESFAAIIERVVKLLSYRIDAEKITLTTHVAEGTPAIPMKVNAMQQVLLDLITNAMDAVKESQKKEVNVEVRKEGDFVRVTISDSGRGIAPENMEKLFAPFFTTKPAGQGTGLGLTVVRSIVHAHGGQITCQSEPGAGTTFNMLLPIKNEKEVTE